MTITTQALRALPHVLIAGRSHARRTTEKAHIMSRSSLDRVEPHGKAVQWYTLPLCSDTNDCGIK
jgi:hypothetical protein